jgi:hypothetical protein
MNAAIKAAIDFGNGIIFVNKTNNAQTTTPNKILGKTEHNGFTNNGSKAPVGLVAAKIKLKIPNTAPVVIPPPKPAIIAASNTGICIIVKEIVGLIEIIPSLVIPRTIINALKAPVNAIFLLVDKELLFIGYSYSDLILDLFDILMIFVDKFN